MFSTSPSNSTCCVTRTTKPKDFIVLLQIAKPNQLSRPQMELCDLNVDNNLLSK